MRTMRWRVELRMRKQTTGSIDGLVQSFNKAECAIREWPRSHPRACAVLPWQGTIGCWRADDLHIPQRLSGVATIGTRGWCKNLHRPDRGTGCLILISSTYLEPFGVKMSLKMFSRHPLPTLPWRWTPPLVMDHGGPALTLPCILTPSTKPQSCHVLVA